MAPTWKYSILIENFEVWGGHPSVYNMYSMLLDELLLFSKGANMNINPYENGDLGSLLYSSFRKELDEFYRSESYFFRHEVFFDRGFSVLDVGGGAGGLGHALKKIHGASLSYTCIDPDKQAIEAGTKQFKSVFPDLELIHGYFPRDLPPGRMWDVVAVIGWFAQVTDWKNFLLQLVARANHYINIGINVRLEGTTVIDPDVSYVYYLDSGVRVPEITHNLWEMLNFCSIHEMRGQKIHFYGYTCPGKPTSAFRPLPRDRQIQGNLLIELSPQNQVERRFGGISNEAMNAMNAQGMDIEVFRPEYNIYINDKKMEV